MALLRKQLLKSFGTLTRGSAAASENNCKYRLSFLYLLVHVSAESN